MIFGNDKMKEHTLQLVIASKNVHKIREIKAILSKDKNLDLLSLIDFPDYTPPRETGTTFEENAIIKAEHAAKTLNHWVISDDSGLVVPALNGEPGIYSARYAGTEATDKDNRKKLLQRLIDKKDEDRQAYFQCVIAIASPEGVVKCLEGTCEGEITQEEKGGGGFGYDPLFIKHGYSKTFSELEETVKNRISHRRKALDKVLLYLESFFRK